MAAIGECMLELSTATNGSSIWASAATSFNTALYLARCNQRERLAVDYVTALGADPYSAAMLDPGDARASARSGGAVCRGKLPVSTCIRTDAAGERRFFYYRSAAAARELFRDPATERLLAALAAYDVLYFTADHPLDPRRRGARALPGCAGGGTRAGRLVAFDSNYRPAGWADAEAARAAIAPIPRRHRPGAPHLRGRARAVGRQDPADTLARYADRNIEVCVKRGGDGCHLGGGSFVAVPQRVAPIDTTAAGDAFNAAYLTARLAGHPPTEAARAGHILAGAVIQHRGAIMPKGAPIPPFPGCDAR